MKDIVIFGNHDFARMIKYYVEEDDKYNRKVVAFTVERDYVKEKKLCGLPVVPFESLEKVYPPNQFDIIIAIGNKKMNDLRKRVFYQCKEKKYNIADYIHSSCRIHTDKIGEGNIILEGCLIYPFSQIGDGNLFWDHITIAHDVVVGNFNTFAGYADTCGYVKIGNNSYFGKHCVLNDYVQIEDYTLVGANAYVKQNTNKYDVVVPVRSFVLENKKSTDLM